MLISCYIEISMIHPKWAYDQSIAKHIVGSFLNLCNFFKCYVGSAFFFFFFTSYYFFKKYHVKIHYEHM